MLSQVLRREVGVTGATLLGLGSILGTGVFVSIGLVAGLAGTWTWVTVVAAAIVAACNALSSAQLAAAFPQSGGAYEYGYRLVHPLAGFTAGWMFLCAKSASAATAALGFSGYLLVGFGREDDALRIGLAAAAVVALTVLVASGLRRSNVANAFMVAVTVLALALFVAAGSTHALANVGSWSTARPGWGDLLQASALMFVAFTGYGRVATLGEEVKNPQQTIPRAIVSTLLVSALLYLAVAWVGVGAVGSEAFYEAAEGRNATLEVVSQRFGWPVLPQVIALGAVTAMLGVLLNLLLGLSRVLLAMGRRGDMPRAVTLIDASRSSPRVAVLAVGAIILGLTLVGSVKTAWSFSAFTVLVYYSLTNLAALRLPVDRRLYPRAWAICGLLGCLVLAFFVERSIWMAGSGVIAFGFCWHAMARALSSR